MKRRQLGAALAQAAPPPLEVLLHLGLREQHLAVGAHRSSDRPHCGRRSQEDVDKVGVGAVEGAEQATRHVLHPHGLEHQLVGAEAIAHAHCDGLAREAVCQEDGVREGLVGREAEAVDEGADQLGRLHGESLQSGEQRGRVQRVRV